MRSRPAGMPEQPAGPRGGSCALGHVVPARAPLLAHAETRTTRIATATAGGDEALEDDLILLVLSPRGSPAKSNSSAVALGVFSCFTRQAFFTSCVSDRVCRDRITEWSGLEGTSVGHPVQPPAEAGSPTAGCT